MRPPYNHLVLCLFTLCLGFIPSCDLTEPKETFYNHNAKPPDLLALDIQQIRPGQHLAGNVSFTFDPTTHPQSIRSVVLVVDTTVARIVYGPPYEFEFDTRLWSDGEHQVSIAVVTNDSQIGLLNLLGAPSTIYSASVVFDQRPPTAVILDSVVWDSPSLSPRLFWRQNNDSNFYAYSLTRESNASSGGYPVEIAFDRTTTSYLDTSVHPITGIKVIYRIEVSNRAASIASNPDTIHFGTTIPASPGSNVGYIVQPIRSPVNDELYVLEAGAIKAVSTLNNTVIRSRTFGTYPLNFALSKDGSKLYVVSTYSPQFTILNAADFSVAMARDWSFKASSIVCGRADRLYITTSFPFSGPVKIVNANTGIEIGELGINAPNGLLAVSSDNNSIYLADTRPELFASATIYKIDITTDSAHVLHQRAASDVVRVLQLSSDDQRLYVVHDNDYPTPPNYFVDIWDPGSLTNLSRINTANWVYDVVATPSSIYVSIAKDGGIYYRPGRVAKYDQSSLTELASWDFLQVPQVIQVSRDNHYLYAFGFESWVITLQP